MVQPAPAGRAALSPALTKHAARQGIEINMVAEINFEMSLVASIYAGKNNRLPGKAKAKFQGR